MYINIKSIFLLTQFLYNKFNVNKAKKFTNCGSNQLSDEISKVILKKYKFSKLWKLEKIMVNAIEDSNKDIYYELFGFFISI